MHNKVFDNNSVATDCYGIMSVKWSLEASNGKISHATTHREACVDGSEQYCVVAMWWY